MKKCMCNIGLYIIFIIVAIITISAKQRLFVDEVYSYGLANSDSGMAMQIEDGKVYEPAASAYEEYLTANKQFDYKTVWVNQKNDVHPPLYYAILHTICSFFPKRYSKWFAGSINILFGLATIYIFGKLVCLLISPRNKNLLGCSLVLTPGFINNITFFRMYVMAMFWIITLTWWITKQIMSEKKETSFEIVLAILTICGGLTHYYCIVYAVFLYLGYFVYLVTNREKKKMVRLIITGVASACIALAIFPSMLIHMFFGGYRGKEAQANLTKISDFFPRIRIFGNILSVQMFGRILIVLIIFILITGISIVIKKRGKVSKKYLNINNLEWCYGIILVACLSYFVFVSISASFQTDRYIYPIYAVILIVIDGLVYYGILYWIQNEKITNRVFTIGVIILISLALYKPQYSNLYLSDKEMMYNLKTKNDMNCICIYEGIWELPSLWDEIQNYKSVTFYQCLDGNNVEEIMRGYPFLDSEKIIVIMAENSGWDRKKIVTQSFSDNMNLVNQGEIAHGLYNTTWIFENSSYQ